MTRNEIIEKVKAVADAPSCYVGLREAVEEYLSSVGTEKEKEAAKTLVAELEADVSTIDSVIAFFESDKGKEYFGAETAANMAKHAHEVKDAGGKYCDCPACAPGKIILDNRDVILQ